MNDYELREAIRAITTPLPESRKLRDEILAELERRGITDESSPKALEFSGLRTIDLRKLLIRAAYMLRNAADVGGAPITYRGMAVEIERAVAAIEVAAEVAARPVGPTSEAKDE